MTPQLSTQLISALPYQASNKQLLRNSEEYFMYPYLMKPGSPSVMTYNPYSLPYYPSVPVGVNPLYGGMDLAPSSSLRLPLCPARLRLCPERRLLRCRGRGRRQVPRFLLSPRPQSGPPSSLSSGADDAGGEADASLGE